jgi:hypothetical protein
MVTTYDASDPHPTHYFRVLLNTEYIRRLIPDNPMLAAQADSIAAIWRDQYGDVASFEAFMGDIPHVLQALMQTPMEILNGRTVQQLIPYTAADEIRIQAAASFLRTGLNAPPKLSIAPRHCVSAARLAAAAAFTQNPEMNDVEVANALTEINARLILLVRDNAAPGLRAGQMSGPHQRFIAGFAEII